MPFDLPVVPTSGTPISVTAFGEKVANSLDALNRDVLWLPVVSVAGTIATNGLNLANLSVAKIGDATQYGDAFFQSFMTLPGFLGEAAGGIEEAKIYLVSTETGVVCLQPLLMWTAEGIYIFGGVPGTGGGTLMGTINVNVTANLLTAVDVSPMFVDIPPASEDQVMAGLSVRRMANLAADTVTNVYIIGARIILRQ